MNVKRIAVILLLIMCLALLDSCIPVNQAIQNPVSTITKTISPESSKILPTSSSSPTPLPINTVSTLSTQQSFQLFKDLLNDENCVLPCLLDMTPGVSKTSEARNILIPFMPFQPSSLGDTLSVDSSGELHLSYTFSDLLISLTPHYSSSNQTTKILDIVSLLSSTTFQNIGDDPRAFASQQYGELFQRYGISEILLKFGRPDLAFITIDVPGDPKASMFIDLRVVYAEKGLYLSYYNILGKSSNNIYQDCPINSWISILAEAPKQNLSVNAVLAKMENWPEYSDLHQFVPLEDATFMNLDDFYGMYINKQDSCFDLKLSPYWWTTPH